MSSDTEIKTLVEQHGQLCALNTQQAAALLQTTESALEKAREKIRRGSEGYAKLPFHSDGKRTLYYLTDLIEFRYKTSTHGLPFFMRTLALMLGPDFCAQVGVQCPQAAQLSATQIVKPDEPPPSMLARVFGLASTEVESVDDEAQLIKPDPKSKKADNLRLMAMQKAGVTVRRNVCRFGSLHDFLAHAEPKDKWLFSCPANGRPYDAIAAIFAGPGDEPFEWLTLTEYFRRVGIHAKILQRTRETNDENALLTNSNSVKQGK